MKKEGRNPPQPFYLILPSIIFMSIKVIYKKKDPEDNGARLGFLPPGAGKQKPNDTKAAARV